MNSFDLMFVIIMFNERGMNKVFGLFLVFY